MTLRHEDGDDDSQPPPTGRRDRRRVSLEGGDKKRGLERRRSRRASLGRSGHASPCSPASPQRAGFKPFSGQRAEDLSERWEQGKIYKPNTLFKICHDVALVEEACFQQMWKNESGMLYCLDSWDARVLTELRGEILNVLYWHFLLQSAVRFPSIHVSSKVSQKKNAAFFFLLLFIYMLWQLLVCLLWQKALWVGFFHSLMTHWCRFVWNLKLLNGLTNHKGFACISNTTSHVIKPAQAYFSSVCVYTTKGRFGASFSCSPQVNISFLCSLIKCSFWFH